MIKVLVDVNLSPAWTEMLATKGIEAVHWTAAGLPTRPRRRAVALRQGSRIRRVHSRPRLRYAARADAGTWSERRPGVDPERLAGRHRDLVARVLTEQAAALTSGALVTVEPSAARVRVLPIVLRMALANGPAWPKTLMSPGAVSKISPRTGSIRED